ncbi:MAG: 3-phosphoshikimate 1-carboxyvinyltransferase [Caulobacterales bacterium]|nr:3-phosphoshikimate 1-carboxyvinyltransferase [Caulobacterales bacterium]
MALDHLDRTTLSARPSGALSGRARAPGDKSISHRALILAAMARGESRIEGLLESDDVLATAAAVAALGAETERLGLGRWRVVGRGGFQQPGVLIDCGNSGTAARLLMGAVAGFAIESWLDGDASLRGRPMGRVAEPLIQMGARVSGDRLPLSVTGGNLSAIHWRSRAASAQVKSAVLLAGLRAVGVTSVTEPAASRDHTERMLPLFGVEVRREGLTASVEGGQTLIPVNLSVPGDPSSAAFPLAAALIVPGSEVTIEGVMLNPGRTGLFETLLEMGADLTIKNRRDQGGETVGDVTVRASRLHGIEVPPERAASMIDEYPILATVAAVAEGRTVMQGLEELRVKESDRIAGTAALLRACGADVDEEPGGLVVMGSGRAPAGGASIQTHGDHRLAMSALVLGLATERPVTVDAPGMIATSFPGFVDLMVGLGAEIAP